jgi:LysM repeat protein
LAALAAGAPPELDDREGPALWPDVSPFPVALDAVHARSRGGTGRSRAGGQALLIGLMVVALLVLVVARANPRAGPAASPSPAASAAVASAPVAASAAATSTPVPTLAVTPSFGAPTFTPAPTRTAAPSASPRTYTVRAGDTIAGIAARYHTTVKSIVAANNIVDPHTIHPGQVLVIP